LKGKNDDGTDVRGDKQQLQETHLYATICSASSCFQQVLLGRNSKTLSLKNNT